MSDYKTMKLKEETQKAMETSLSEFGKVLSIYQDQRASKGKDKPEYWLNRAVKLSEITKNLSQTFKNLERK